MGVCSTGPLISTDAGPWVAIDVKTFYWTSIKLTLAQEGRLYRRILRAVIDRDETYLRSLPYVTKFRFAALPQNRRHIPTSVRKAVMARDGALCNICGSADRPELDHIVPHVHGGPDTIENLRVLCKPCNIRRGAPKE